MTHHHCLLTRGCVHPPCAPASHAHSRSSDISVSFMGALHTHIRFILYSTIKTLNIDASSSWTVGRMHSRRVKNWKIKPSESAASLWKNGFIWTHQGFSSKHFKCIKQSFLQIHIFPLTGNRKKKNFWWSKNETPSKDATKYHLNLVGMIILLKTWSFIITVIMK